ncbi:MAG: threonylcarbamoyl-AMP synthase [Zoogloeaceae bacterium]|nr:threonylcarbamoyl-AMP synthase [Rhodocyclaceae bacterium]MCP5234863.1 threonylcarbamoyl-AMP synthase [Zoogloeaceae bacterium]
MAISDPTAEAIARAADLLRAGGLVGMPTETVYGLAADAANDVAVADIFRAKGRPVDHPLIVHLGDAELLPAWAEWVPKEAIALARAFWPGPLTMILPKAADVSELVTGGQTTVGLRMPDHPVALALLRAFGGGLAAPSANRFGRISPTTAAHVESELGDAVPIVLDGGDCQVGIESTILDLSGASPVVLRPGAISADAIAAVIGRRPMQREDLDAGADVVRVSGALPAHYAPVTAMQLLPLSDLMAAAAAGHGERVAVLARAPMPADFDGIWLRGPHSADAFARALYADLRALDAAGCARILVETPPPDEAWRAIRDRLERAARGAGARDST